MIIKLGPMQYRVDFKPPTQDSSWLGSIDYRRCIIEIAPDMPDQGRKQVLCHEIAHSMLDRCGDTPEAAAESLGDQMLMFIQDNPDVIKYLQKSEKHKWK